MSTTGTETTIGFQLSLGGKSDHGAQQGDGGAGQSRSTEVATLGRDSENDVQPLFEGVHLLFVEKVWNDVEAQMLQLLARVSLEIISLHSVIPLWYTNPSRPILPCIVSHIQSLPAKRSSQEIG